MFCFHTPRAVILLRVRPDPGYALTFRNTRWTDDVKVSGSAKWNRETGHVTATLDVIEEQGLTATVNVAYDAYDPNAVIKITGSSGGNKIRSRLTQVRAP
jgi:hypothetical protein